MQFRKGAVRGGNYNYQEAKSCNFLRTRRLNLQNLA